jgi:UDP-3-O-[3-hydroxymyristoyl] glucosamine N-acyltransferase
MKYRLSSFASERMCVVRDGAFAVTGKLSTPLDELCVPLRSAKFVAEVNANSRVAAVITKPDLAEQLDGRLAVAISDDPDAAHAEVHAEIATSKDAELLSIPTRIDSSAMVDDGARISSFGVEIGPKVRVGPNVVIGPGVCVEEGAVLHPGVVLGVSGFNTGVIGGRQRIIPQLGGVRLKPFVELLANVCVARALFGGETLVGEETVADNLVYIAHDVQIGRRVQICALVNILGRTIIEDEVYVGPSAVVRNGLRIGAKAKISIGAVVTQDVPAASIVTGNFAIDHDRFVSHIRSIR